jgi:hypothetical protein
VRDVVHANRVKQGKWLEAKYGLLGKERRLKNLAAKQQKTGLDKALEMHQAGMTYQEIADFIGVTRCAVAGYVFRQKRGMDQ